MAPYRFPFSPYPVGWFQIALSENLAAGQVIPLRAFGRALVLFRGVSGTPALLDAYCPHLGAHLGHGGLVVGDQLQCPFHAWRFGSDGRCTHVPYADRVPKVGLTRWPIRENNGFIVAYNGDKQETADWEPPALEVFGSPEWTDYGSASWRVRTHVQEVAENIPDGAHFHYVHQSATLPQTSAHFIDRRCEMHSTMHQHTPRGPVEASIDAVGHGLGLWEIRFGGIIDTAFVTAITPIDEQSVWLRTRFVVREPEPGRQSGLGHSMVAHIKGQIEEDIPIWENKVYRDRPILLPEDGPIRQFRQWASQFHRAGEQDGAAADQQPTL